MGRKKNPCKKGEVFFSANVAATLQTWQAEQYLNSGNSLNGINNKTVRTWDLDCCNLCLAHHLEQPQYTLIRFGKFEEINVLMAKTCNFELNISDFNSVDLKKTQKIIKGQIFFSKAKFEGQRPKNSNFMIFSVIWVSLQTIVQKNSLV